MKRQGERASAGLASSSAKRAREPEAGGGGSGRRAAPKSSPGQTPPRDRGRASGDYNRRPRPEPGDPSSSSSSSSASSPSSSSSSAATAAAASPPRVSPLLPLPPPPLLPAPPPEYKTLLVSSLSPALPAEHLEDRLFQQFKRFGEISLRLSHTPELGRVAYVNFRHPQDARDARHHARARQLLLYDRPLKVEPVYLRGGGAAPAPPDPLGYLPPPTGYPYRQPRARHAAVAAAAFALDAAAAGLVRERALDYYGLYEERARPYGHSGPGEEELMPEDDQRATRNLFVGNLDHGASEAELRRAFEKYGVIEEVVIKRPARGQGGAYAFLKFQNLDMAHRAKVAMSGRVVGRNPIKIGYGKADPTTRLWVGGLGPNTSLAALAREFDRFGSIRTIDYAKGGSSAYIQYDSLDAAQAACAQMRGFPLGGADRRLRVDFAKAEESRPPPPQYQPPLFPLRYDVLPAGYVRHRGPEADLRVRDRTPPHLLYSDRERGFGEGDRAGPAKTPERRGGDRWGGAGDRGPARPREERRKRRSPSGDHGRAARSPPEDRAGPKAGGPPSERGPEGLRCEHHTPGWAGQDEERSDSLPDERRAGRESPEPPQAGKKRDGERGEAEPRPPDEPRAETKKLGSLCEFAQTLPLGWSGLLVLKNSCFPTTMHILEGELGVVSGLLKDPSSGGELAQLKIAQRLRLDQPKLDEVTRRIRRGSPNGCVVLLATQASAGGGAGGDGASPAEPALQRRLLRNLVSYLKQKQAAGVISLPVGGAKGRDGTGVLYAFPPCEFSHQYLQSALRTLGKLEEEHMVIVIVRDTA
ncbi:LOW QUALITY PROTEIN: putative RNA-binding protein 15B [Tachyglossus aculeatus]|uniref:LOW QUALITY PROTEIN: putative RNA-binding protein 15B n=1 Tax=Tachyglossus aculeatus TaxID=9261 RepID=UPI0018F667F6|nr:LOW QUALITY PROTEIN: putative RNA-binding protein 15B [Tachyglossus aculeatus]